MAKCIDREVVDHPAFSCDCCGAMTRRSRFWLEKSCEATYKTRDELKEYGWFMPRHTRDGKAYPQLCWACGPFFELAQSQDPGENSCVVLEQMKRLLANLKARCPRD